MILPIHAFGLPVLKERAQDVDLSQKDEIQKTLADMYETMYAASGMGLAAPQVGRSERIFIIGAQ